MQLEAEIISNLANCMTDQELRLKRTLGTEPQEQLTKIDELILMARDVVESNTYYLQSNPRRNGRGDYAIGHMIKSEKRLEAELARMTQTNSVLIKLLDSTISRLEEKGQALKEQYIATGSGALKKD